MSTITCMRCGHGAEVDAPADALAHGIFRCDECQARMSYGVLMPRVVCNTEAPDFVTIKFDDADPIRLDKQYAKMVAEDLRSVAK